MKEKALSLFAMLAAGKSLALLLDPQGFIEVWSGPAAPRWYRKTMSYFAERPGLCRAVSVLGLAAAAGLFSCAGRVNQRRLAGRSGCF